MVGDAEQYKRDVSSGVNLLTKERVVHQEMIFIFRRRLPERVASSDSFLGKGSVKTSRLGNTGIVDSRIMGEVITVLEEEKK